MRPNHILWVNVLGAIVLLAVVLHLMSSPAVGQGGREQERDAAIIAASLSDGAMLAYHDYVYVLRGNYLYRVNATYFSNVQKLSLEDEEAPKTQKLPPAEGPESK